MQCIIYTTLVLCHAPVMDPSARVAMAFAPEVEQTYYVQETPAQPRVQARKQTSAAAVQLTAVPRYTRALARKKQGKPAVQEPVVMAYAEPEKRKGPLAAFFSPGTAPAKAPKGMSPGYAAVYAASVKHGVDPNFMLKVAKIENGGNCRRSSGAGARGVLQVMPNTAKGHGVKNAKSLDNCKVGAETGVKEMKKLLAMAKGNKKLAAIGYNCGPACIGRKKLPRETVNYVKKLGL